MAFGNEIEAFIKDYVKHLLARNAAVFAGAGLSKNVGFVDWPDLLRDIATELGLDVDKEHDLISLAQYHVNHRGSAAGVIRKILEEFVERADPSINHDILARLPITTFWTTNYDTLIEDALRSAFKVPDIKSRVSQFSNTKPKRDAVVYKMHGDVSDPANAVLTKEHYERYFRTHEAFVTALSGDLTAKTFLFIGFSFSDPNLDYVLSRLHISTPTRQHYSFMRKEKRREGDDDEMFRYRVRKQELRISDLKRYRIQTLLVDEYEDITKILLEIEVRFRKKTVFVSGSAEIYGRWDRLDAQSLIHNLSRALILEDYRVVNGFGWGVGSAVINGALEAIYQYPEKFSEDQLVVRPFPQFATKGRNLGELWEEYRHRMISLAGIGIFMFGNKKVGEDIVLANGVVREFEIAIEHGLIPIPIGATGHAARHVFELLAADPKRYFLNNEWLMQHVVELNSDTLTSEQTVSILTKILQRLKR